MFLEKTKTAKEEARELQLKEEGSIREMVMSIQQSISLMLKALGEMAIANPIFTHSQLPSSVSFHFCMMTTFYRNVFHSDSYTSLAVTNTYLGKGYVL